MSTKIDGAASDGSGCQSAEVCSGCGVCIGLYMGRRVGRYLRNNQITSIPDGFLGNAASLEYMWVSGIGRTVVVLYSVIHLLHVLTRIDGTARDGS